MEYLSPMSPLDNAFDEDEMASLRQALLRAPRRGMAYKFPAREESIDLLDVGCQSGRIAALTTVVWLELLGVGRVSVSNVISHHFDEIPRLGAEIGGTVVVRRAGAWVSPCKCVVATGDGAQLSRKQR